MKKKKENKQKTEQEKKQTQEQRKEQEQKETQEQEQKETQEQEQKETQEQEQEKKQKKNKADEEVEIELKTKAKKLLISTEDYKKAAVIFGTKVITGYMEKYVYKRRADGLAIIDVEKTDEKIKAAINFLTQFKPEDILVFCKREVGWKAAEKFGEITKARVFTRRYPSGIITNPTLPNFFEPKVLFVVDPWIDKNAIFDALRIGIPVISICDTNNVTNNIDLVIPANNKAKTSLALIFYLITKGFAKAKGIPFKAKLEDFDADSE